MDLRQLRAFVHAAELGSISLAAARLHVAQSALTRLVQSLEADLGVRLLHRHGRGVTLTPAGQAALPRALALLQGTDDLRGALAQAGDALTGEIAFGVPPTVAGVLSGAVIEGFARAHPHVTLRVVSGYSGHVLDWLQSGAVDLGIVYDTGPAPTIRKRALLVERLYLVQAADAEGGGDGEVTLAQVAALRLILPSRQHGLRQVLDMAAARQGLTLTAGIEADALPVQVDLVRRGLGATVLPWLPVHDDVRAGRLLARPIREADVSRSLALATALAHPPGPAVRVFAAAVADGIAALVNAGRWEGARLAGADMPKPDS